MQMGQFQGDQEPDRSKHNFRKRRNGTILWLLLKGTHREPYIRKELYSITIF